MAKSRRCWKIYFNHLWRLQAIPFQKSIYNFKWNGRQQNERSGSGVPVAGYWTAWLSASSFRDGVSFYPAQQRIQLRKHSGSRHKKNADDDKDRAVLQKWLAPTVYVDPKPPSPSHLPSTSSKRPTILGNWNLSEAQRRRLHLENFARDGWSHFHNSFCLKGKANARHNLGQGHISTYPFPYIRRRVLFRVFLVYWEYCDCERPTERNKIYLGGWLFRTFINKYMWIWNVGMCATMVSRRWCCNMFCYPRTHVLTL